MSDVEALDAERTPPKPGMPIMLPLALVFWGGCALAYDALEGAGSAQCSAILCACSAAGAVCALAGALRRVRPAALLAAALALGCATGALGAWQVMSGAAGAIGERGAWRLQLVSDCAPSAFGSSASADAVGPQGQRARVHVRFADDAELLRGDAIIAQASPRALKEQARSFYWSQGIGCEMAIDRYGADERSGPIAALQEVRRNAIGLLGEHGGEQAGLLQALACGYRQGIEQSGAYEGFKRCGLAHLVAVSGAHLAIVVLLVRWALRAARMPLVAANIACIALIMAYLVLAGVPISAVRAAFMVALALASSFAKRRDSSLSALALCIVAFLCASPPTAVSASFVLSVGSTLGILLFAGLMASWAESIPERLRRPIAAPLGMTLASNAATLPYSMALFSQLPLIAPLANIAAAPVFTIACLSSVLAACIACAVPQAAPAVVHLAALAAMPLDAVVGALAQVPFACVAVSVPAMAMLAVTLAVCGALWLLWPQVRTARAAAALGGAYALAAVIIALAPFAHAGEVVMLDVGQGDAFLVRSRGASILIDTGDKDALLRQELAEQGVFRLDAVVVSHPDADHCGSLSSLAAYVEIGRVYAAEPLLSCACGNCAQLRADALDATGQGIAGLTVGDELRAGAFDLRVVWPDAFCDEGGNADSLCLLAEADCDGDGCSEHTILFTGDAEAQQLAQMVDAGRVGGIDVLKVGHHGSRVALTPELAGVLDPEIALVSCGAQNRYGHPAAETIEHLGGATILRTDADGTVVLTFTEGGIAARTSA